MEVRSREEDVMLKKMLKSYDYSLIFAIVLLCGFGLVMVYSSSMITAVSRYGVSSNFFFMRQLFALIAGGALFILMALFPYKALAIKSFRRGYCLYLFLRLSHCLFSGMLPETRRAGLKSAE